MGQVPYNRVDHTHFHRNRVEGGSIVDRGERVVGVAPGWVGSEMGVVSADIIHVYQIVIN